MPNDEITNKKRLINARISALRSAGRTDDQIADSVMAIPNLGEGAKAKLKQAKVIGNTKAAIDSLFETTKVTEPVTQADDFKVEGFGGKAARFLGIEKIGRYAGAKLAMLDPQHRENLRSIGEEEAKTIGSGGVSGREAIGSAGNLALNLAGGALIKGGARALGYGGKALGLMKPVMGTAARGLTPAQMAARPVATIAKGAGLGYAQDVASNLNDNKRGLEAFTPGVGTITGGVIGSVPAARRLLGGKAQKEVTSVLQKITPDLKDIPEAEYKKLLAQGRVTPRTALKPAQYVLTDKEIAAATRHADLIDNDPVRTSLNIKERLAELDNQVGEFLTQNNVPINRSELKVAIKEGMEKINDISVPESRILKYRNQLINNFMDTLQNDDAFSLWNARKDFDQAIDGAFSGSPTLQKEMKKAFRNSVQDFIAKKTPNKTYKQFMGDMSSLFDVDDLVTQSAAKERGYSTVTNWLKDNPIKAKVLGIGTAFGAGAVAAGMGVRSLYSGNE